MRKLSNLVARLLGQCGLTPSRVMQHRNFSGKHCPGSMIDARKGRMFAYETFYHYMETEYFIMTNLTDSKWTYTSLNPELVTNEGEILKYVQDPTQVAYTVEVTFGGVTVKRDFKTIIHPVNEERPEY